MTAVKVVVAGGRDFDDRELLNQEINSLLTGQLQGFTVTIVSGMAKGADMMAWQFAQRNGLACDEFIAEWRPGGVYDNAAGMKRNARMAAAADALLAFWDGQSRGTKDMIDRMKALGKPVRVVRYTGQPKT